MLTVDTFSMRIEKIVMEKGIDYFEAILLYCEENEMEEEVAASLLNSKIKQQLIEEAHSARMLKSSVELEDTLPL